MPRKNWISELEYEVEREILDHRKPRDAAPRPRFVVHTQEENKTGVMLFLIALMLTVGLVGVFIWKNNYQQIAHVQPNYPEYRNWQKEEDKPYLDYASQEDFDQIREAQTKIWERTKWNTDIITLMSIVENHNLAVSQNGYPKSHYIYINSDWTIDRIPQYVQLSERDRQFLEKYVKKNHVR